MAGEHENHRGSARPERGSTRPRRMPIWRVLVPAIVILGWLAGAALGGPLFGRVSEVSSNDASAYLPKTAESTQVSAVLTDFTGSDVIPAVVVIVGDERPLTPADLAQIGDALTSLTDVPGVAAASPPIPSEDGKAAQAFVPIDASADVAAVVEAIEHALAAELPEGTTSYVTGPAGLAADLTGAFEGIDGILLAVAVVAVLVILLLVYRSVVLPAAVLATSLFALCVALLVVFNLAKAGVILLSGQTQGILFILVIGAATDYSLLYVARYREELRVKDSRLAATRSALRGVIEPIAASGGTVIAGLLCLLLSDLKSNSTLGPVASIGIVVAMASALTLLPALLLIFGRAAFWPRRPHFEPEVVRAEGGLPPRGLWTRLGRHVAHRPRPIWVGVTVVLVAGLVAAGGFKASGVAQSELVLTASQARDGQAALAKHFAPGTGSPAIVVVSQDELPAAAAVLSGAEGVASVTAVSADSPSGQVAIGADGDVAAAAGAGAQRDGQTAGGPSGAEGDDGAAEDGDPTAAADASATVVDGRVMLQATLTHAADSMAAENAVRQLRADLHAAAPSALVGGVTATAIDTNDASAHDRTLIIPIVLAVILLILMLLLRSVLAPVLLVATTVLSFGAAMGVAALVFNHVLNLPGADPAVPLFGFVFLVALGIDYNIFLMTRVREESVRHGTRPGVLRGLAITGGVITSAGVVLAATFAALAVIPILFLAQLAFIVAFGVLLDTFIVRTLLVPALAYDIGGRIWWPSRLAADSRNAK